MSSKKEGDCAVVAGTILKGNKMTYIIDIDGNLQSDNGLGIAPPNKKLHIDEVAEELDEEINYTTTDGTFTGTSADVILSVNINGRPYYVEPSSKIDVVPQKVTETMADKELAKIKEHLGEELCNEWTRDGELCVDAWTYLLDNEPILRWNLNSYRIESPILSIFLDVQDSCLEIEFEDGSDLYLSII